MGDESLPTFNPLTRRGWLWEREDSPSRSWEPTAVAYIMSRGLYQAPHDLTAPRRGHDTDHPYFTEE